MLTAEKRKSKTIQSVRRTGDDLILQSEHGILKLSPKSENIVRISAKPDCEDAAAISAAGIGISNDDAYDGWQYTEADGKVILTTPKLKLEVNKATASIRYFDSSGSLLLSERGADSRVMEGFDSYKTVIDESTQVESIKTADGVKQRITGSNKVFDKKLYRTRLHLEWQEDEALFGLGQAEEGTLNLRGTTQYLHQANMKIAVPLMLSTKGYGLLLATGSTAIFNDTAYGSYLYTEADEKMDYYIIAGSFDEIIKGYRYLSGKAVMLPKWAFGYVQSCERYETADELIDTVKEYRRRGVGLDCIVLDWISWPDGLWGQKTFDKSRFPDPKAMLDEIHALNARMMISIWPAMDQKSDNYKEFEDAKLLFPANNIFNAFEEKARALYWKQANEGLFKYGMDAWWCDSSEPYTPEWVTAEKPEASILYNQFVREAGGFMPMECINAYGLKHAQGIYEGQRSVREDKRIVNLTRSGYTGQQKYGAILWSGDISASWETLQRQIVAGLNFCASGLPYWTLDIGAFFVKQGIPWYWNGEYDAGTEDMGYRELYTRWFQYGAFLPVFRAHGTDIKREIWAFGEAGEMFYDALVSAIKLRYSLMPYIYSSAAAVWYNDDTMMKMLAFDFCEDKTAISVKDQYMFGPAIMVCPVTSAMYYDKGSRPIDGAARSREVYLPAGTDWYDFYTDKKYKGGSTITCDAPIDKIPLFVKAGSIVPMQPPVTYSTEDPGEPVTLKVYPGSGCEFMYYSDSNDGYAYEQGQYNLTRIKWNESSREVTYETVHESSEITKPEFTVDVVS